MSTIFEIQSTPHVGLQTGMWRSVLGIVLSAIGGLMMLLAFPPYGIWPLAWVAFIPALFAQYRLFTQRWSSLAGSLLVLFWLGPYMGSAFGPRIAYLGVPIALSGLFIYIERKFHEMSGFRWFVLYGMFLFVGMEMVRASFIPGFGTAAFIGYTQASQPWMLQPVAILGIYGFDFLILMVNYALALRLLAWYDRKYPSANVLVEEHLSKQWSTIGGTVLVVWIGLSLLMLYARPQDTPTVRVASLRSGFTLTAVGDKETVPRVRFDTFASQAREAAAQGAQVLVTPELMFGFDPQLNYTKEFKAIARETDTYIFIGYGVVDNVKQTFRNQMVLLSPAGEFSAIYSKNHPVPPYEPLSLGAGVYPVFNTPFGNMAAMICQDTNFTDVSRKLALNGAQLIADGFDLYSGDAEQKLTYITFRAIENHTAFIATDTSHLSAIVDGNGRRIAMDVDADQEGSALVMVADVPMGSGATVYSSFGDMLGWVALVGFAFFFTFMVVVRIRARVRRNTAQPLPR